MRRDEALRILSGRRSELEPFHIKSLALFGSVARDEAEPGSDVDVLVEFDAPTSFDQYMGLRLLLEDLFGCRVDLVTRNGLKPRARPYVEKDAILVT